MADEGPKPEAAGVRRTRAFRERLLTKLPTLAYTSWTVKDDFPLEEELEGVLRSRADALLTPLERAAPEHLR